MKYYIVLVQFGVPSPSGKEYAYFSRFEHEPGEVVVVNTPRQLAVVTVTTTKGITPEQSGQASKWIVDTVDIKAHEEYMEELNESR